MSDNPKSSPVQLSRIEVDPCPREVWFVKESPTARTFRLTRPGPVFEITQSSFRLPECLLLSFSQVVLVQNKFAWYIVCGIIWIVPSVQVVVVFVVVVVVIVVIVVVVVVMVVIMVLFVVV